MGLGTSIKDLYYHLEDRYYEVLDKINSKVPVYKVTDQIDKVVPSFALLLLLIIILMVYLATIFLVPLLAPVEGVFTLSVADAGGNMLEGAEVEITYMGEMSEFTTDEKGGIGEFKVYVGTEIARLSVTMDGYKIIKPASTELFNILIEKEETAREFEFEFIVVTEPVTFHIVDADTREKLKNVSLSFRCANPDVAAPLPITSQDGTITLHKHKDCGELTADVFALGYDKRNDVVIQDGASIFLSGPEDPEPPEDTYGTVIVDLWDSAKGERAQGAEITVRLYKHEDGAQQGIEADNDRTITGQVTFDEVIPGKYTVKSSPTSTLTGEESAFIFISAGDRKTTRLYLKEQIIGHIKLRIIDHSSKKAVKDAALTLLEGPSQVDTGKTDENGEHAFPLKKDVKHNLVIDKEGYCLTRLVDLVKGDDVKEVKLKRYTGPNSECGGAVIARVKDDLGDPVQNAVVMLFNEEGYYLGTQRTTDANGEAEFTGINNGTYQVFAYKGYGNGWSDTQEFVAREGAEKIFNVTLTIPNGAINVQVVDEDGEPLQYMLVTMRAALTDKKLEGPVPIENEDGTRSFEVIAGEPVFFHIQDKDNVFADYISEPIIVEPDSTKDVNFMLEIKRISGDIQAEFLGLFKNEKNATILGAGEEYTAKFRIWMPDTADYDRIGLHVRTGYKNLMELDNIYIKEESVPGAPNILRGTSYDPGNGINHDSQFYSADGSKWMNFEWHRYTKGILHVELTIKIRETAGSDQELPVFWRAWAKKNSTITRDPKDVELGNAETQNDLYAETYKQTFTVGVETLCTDQWCYSAKILDVDADLIEMVDEHYSGKVGKQYKLDFSILNNSDSKTDNFHDVTIQVKNPEETITFGSYTFEGELTVSGDAQDIETPASEIGDLPINREVRGTVYFTPKANLASSIVIRLHDPNLHRHVFEKIISLDLAAAEGFEMQFEKEGEYQDEAPILPSGIENELKVKVLRARDSYPIENATVKLKNKFGDTLQETTTSSLGIAVITVPILKPGETLFVVAEKPDYESLEREITVDNAVLEVKPEKLGFSLSVVNDNPDSQSVKLVNLTEMELTLEAIDLGGDFQGLIDEEKARDWLFSEYLGKKIGPKGEIELSVKLELSDLGLLLEEGKTVGGKINFTVSAMGKAWVFGADVTASIGLGGETDTPDCFTITKHLWEYTLPEQQAVTDFMIVNSCAVNGIPVELKNVSAKIEWKSNHLGEFEIKIDPATAKLYGSYPKILRGRIGKEEAIPSTLTFTPEGGVRGTAEATITISAQHATEGGMQTLSDSMDVSLKIVNAAGCLRFSKDLIKMFEGEEESFTIEATEDCGGEIAIELDSKLTTSQKEFTLQVGESKDITVLAEANFPGQYPIYVFQKGPGNREFSFSKLVRVIIDTDGCLKLNKYEYDIADCENVEYDGYDTGKLINVCHSKGINAEVKFSEKDLWEAFLDSWPWAIAGFIWGGINAMAEGKTFWGTEKPGTVCANAGYEYCGDKLVCRNEKIKEVKNVICCASECVTSEEGKDLRDELCEKRGYTYCGSDGCVGEKVPVKSIYCCKGICQAEFEIEAFLKICRGYRMKYCKPDEQCSKDYEWKEGVRCCPGKCRTPEKYPQLQVCERYGLGFCNEKDGWFCPTGLEEILPEKHLKCCAAECVREEIKEEREDICEEDEICVGVEIEVDGETYCDEPCTPEEEEITSDDEICLSAGATYDNCAEGQYCLEGFETEMDSVNCCRHMCLDPDATDFYKDYCNKWDADSPTAFDFCDEANNLEKCDGQWQFTTTEPNYGLPCCDQPCTDLFEEEEIGEENGEEEVTGTEGELDNICRQSRGGQWYYDHCADGTFCFHRQADRIGGVNCCRHTCIEPEKELEYQAACAAEGGNYCDNINTYCGATSDYTPSQQEGYEGLPCCPGECAEIPEYAEDTGIYGLFTHECIGGEYVENAQPVCNPQGSKSYTYMEAYNSDCSTTLHFYEQCDWYQECFSGACVTRTDMSESDNENYCQRFNDQDLEWHYPTVNNCVPANYDPISYSAPKENKDGIICCSMDSGPGTVIGGGTTEPGTTGTGITGPGITGPTGVTPPTGGISPCTDSDNGKNYSVDGTLRGYSTYWEQAELRPDVCLDMSGGSTYGSPVASCNGPDCYLLEYFCTPTTENPGEFDSEEIPCSEGCSVGACTGAGGSARGTGVGTGTGTGTTGGTGTGTGTGTAGSCSSVPGYLVDCPEGKICMSPTCGTCTHYPKLVSQIGGKFCCTNIRSDIACYNSDGTRYIPGTLAPTPTATPTATPTETPVISGPASEYEACQEAGLGTYCAEGLCNRCAKNPLQPDDEGTCYRDWLVGEEEVPNGETTEFNGEQIYCCPMDLPPVTTYSCAGTAVSAGEEELGLPTALALGGILDIGGGIIGGLNEGISAILGIDNPWIGAIAGSAAGTAYNYFFVQEEGAIPYFTTVRDLNVLSLKLFIPAGLEELDESKITVETGESNIKHDPDWPLGIEETELVFTNNGITQDEPYKPIFRVLKAEGEKYDYNTQFDVKMKEDAEALAKGEFLEVKSTEGFTQKFHLQFNAYCGKEPEPDVPEWVDCMIDGMTGETGEQALPDVLFKWDWASIKDNTCDEDGGRTFCDATQFSLELLQKIHAVDELLRGGAFSCPSIEGVLTEVDQDLSDIDLDVGLTKIRIQKTGKNAKVIGTIESNNDKQMTVNAVISLRRQGTTTPIECPEAAEKAVEVISRSDVECTFNDLDNGLYTARVEINPQLNTCESDCKNIETGNDFIETKLFVGDSGELEKCEPYTTERISEYAAANPNSTNLKKAVELTNFKAHLIMDGYTNDFRNDFHAFTEKAFFNTPSYYRGDAGLWKYFTNPDLMVFENPLLRPESGRIHSGKYQVRIFIEYDDSSWSLFKESQPNAKIRVKLDLLSHPEPDSPFYYMPYNGLVGIDTANGRQGYGVNYRQESLAEIRINDDPSQLIRTSTIAPSTPIPGGWVYTAKSENFKMLNNDRRGVVMDVEHSSTESSIILSPSDATPVLLRVSGGESERAWAFYNLTIDGEPQIVGPNLTSWTGYARGCRDFMDREMYANYMNKKDVHGGTTRAGACARIQRKSDYGLEWCEVNRAGIVHLATVFFTPQGTEATLEMADSLDDAYFIAPGTSGSKKVTMQGVYNVDIESVERVFELVKMGDVCVAGAGSSAKTTFFWNPKMVIEKSLGSQMASAASECIPPE